MSKTEYDCQTARKNRSDGVIRKRKQLDRQKIPLTKEPQVARWLLTALLFFDRIPHGSLSNFRELWGILSKKRSSFSGYPLGRSNYVKRCLLPAFKVKITPSVRGPPLLKSWLFKISEDGGLPHGKAILHKEGPRCLWPGY